MTTPAITAFPLTWPAQFTRRQPSARENGSFKTELAKALKNVESSLSLFARDSGKKIEALTISSNVTLGAQRPADPAVAVWFTWDGLQVCIPVDRYNSVAANLQAIHHIIEARRTELRHGTLQLVRATFTGFKSLPAPAPTDWRAVLKCPAAKTAAEAEAAYQKARSAAHPDHGGNNADFDRVQKAWDAARLELKI